MVVGSSGMLVRWSSTLLFLMIPMYRFAIFSRIRLLSDQNLSHSMVTTRLEKP